MIGIFQNFGILTKVEKMPIIAEKEPYNLFFQPIEVLKIEKAMLNLLDGDHPNNFSLNKKNQWVFP